MGLPKHPLTLDGPDDGGDFAILDADGALIGAVSGYARGTAVLFQHAPDLAMALATCVGLLEVVADKLQEFGADKAAVHVLERTTGAAAVLQKACPK